MATNVGTVSAQLTLDTKRAQQEYRRFQSEVSRSSRRYNALGRIGDDAKEFESALSAATNRVTAFAAAAVVFNTVKDAVQSFAKSIVEVDQSLARINVNLGESGEGLKKFSSDLFNVARQTGQTFETAAEGAEELARQGLGAENTIVRLKDALMLARIAGISSTDAVEALTAAVNSFQDSALSSTEVVNKFAAVDTKFAVSSRDLAEAISRVGSTAQAAGVGVDELVGLVTSLQQTTARGGATIGNGLKTIFTRIQAAPETVKALQDLGVAIKDTSGNLRPAISILKDYAQARQSLGDAERASADRTIAGTFQVNILKAALADLSKEYSIYDNALQTSSNATDEAIRKNAKLNETLSSLINTTAISVKQLFSAIGEQSVAPIIKDILGGIEQIRKTLSGESGSQVGEYFGQAILSGITKTLTGPLLVGLVVVLGKAFAKIFSTISQEVKALISINNEMAVRAKIQEKILFLERQATQQEFASYKAASSIVEKKAQLLAIEERILATQLRGTELSKSFVKETNFGVVKRYSAGSFLKTKIPGMADPIASAIAKESQVSGLPASQIYVSSDSRVANFANPAGIVVANRRDEPSGAFQGVNRVLAQGGNPKTGSVPNFAYVPLTGRDLPFVSKKVLDQINAALLSASRQTSMKGFLKEIESVTDISMSRKLPATSSSKLQSIVASLGSERVKIEQMRVKNAYRALSFEKKEERLAELRVSLKESEARVLKQKSAQLAQTPRERWQEQYRTERIESSEFGSKDRPMFFRKQEQRLIKLRERLQESQARVIGSTYSEPIGPIPQVTMYPSAIGPMPGPREQTIREKWKQQSGARRIEQGRWGKGRPAEFEKQNERWIELRRALKQSEQEKKRRAEDAALVEENQRQTRKSNRIFMGGLAVGFLGGAIPTDSETAPGGTKKGMAYGAASGAAQGASIGAMTGTVQGAAIGTAIGAVAGAFSKLQKTTQELISPLEKQTAEQQKVSQQVQRYGQIQEEINRMEEEGGSSETLNKLRKSRDELLASMDENWSKKLLDAGNNLETLSEISRDASDSLEKMNTKTEEFGVLISKLRPGVVFGPQGIDTKEAKNLGRQLASQVTGNIDTVKLREVVNKLEDLKISRQVAMSGMQGGVQTGMYIKNEGLGDILGDINSQLEILFEAVPELRGSLKVTSDNAEEVAQALIQMAIGIDEARKQQKKATEEDIAARIQLKSERKAAAELISRQSAIGREGVLERGDIGRTMISQMASMLQTPTGALETAGALNVQGIEASYSNQIAVLSEDFAKQLREALLKNKVAPDFAKSINLITDFDEMIEAARDYQKANNDKINLEKDITQVIKKENGQIAELKTKRNEAVKTENARTNALKQQQALMARLNMLSSLSKQEYQGGERFAKAGTQARFAPFLSRTGKNQAEIEKSQLDLLEEMQQMNLPMTDEAEKFKRQAQRSYAGRIIGQRGQEFLQSKFGVSFGDINGPWGPTIKGTFQSMAKGGEGVSQFEKVIAQIFTKAYEQQENKDFELPKAPDTIGEMKKVTEDQKKMLTQMSENYDKVAKALMEQKIDVSILGEIQLKSDVISPEVLGDLQRTVKNNLIPIVEQRIKEIQKPTPPKSKQEYMPVVWKYTPIDPSTMLPTK